MHFVSTTEFIVLIKIVSYLMFSVSIDSHKKYHNVDSYSGPRTFNPEACLPITVTELIYIDY